MRKIVAILVVSLLSISASVTPATSAVKPKPGAVCVKKGESRSVKGIKLTCSKTGKQLKWKVAKSQSVVAKPNTTKPESPKPQLPITFDNLDREGTANLANRLVNEYYLKTSPVSSTAIHYVGPTVREDILAEEKRLLQIGERFFYDYFKPAKFHVLVFSEKDGDWLDSTKDPAFHNRSSLKKSIEASGNWCTWAGATRHVNGEPLFYMCLQTTGRSTADKQTTIHEYFHLLQDSFGGQEKMPCWIMEGSATFFGISLGVSPVDPLRIAADKFLLELSYNYNPQGTVEINGPNTTMRDDLLRDNGAISIMKELEFLSANSNRNCPAWGAYTAGWLATEALVAVDGVEKFLGFLQQIPKETSWKVAFEKTYNMSTEVFYQKLAPYLISRLAN